MKQELIDKVLKQITEDVMNGDMTAIEELIAGIPDEAAQAFLPEVARVTEEDKAMADAAHQQWLNKHYRND